MPEHDWVLDENNKKKSSDVILDTAGAVPTETTSIAAQVVDSDSTKAKEPTEAELWLKWLAEYKQKYNPPAAQSNIAAQVVADDDVKTSVENKVPDEQKKLEEEKKLEEIRKLEQQEKSKGDLASLKKEIAKKQGDIAKYKEEKEYFEKTGKGELESKIMKLREEKISLREQDTVTPEAIKAIDEKIKNYNELIAEKSDFLKDKLKTAEQELEEQQLKEKQLEEQQQREAAEKSRAEEKKAEQEKGSKVLSEEEKQKAQKEAEEAELKAQKEAEEAELKARKKADKAERLEAKKDKRFPDGMVDEFIWRLKPETREKVMMKDWKGEKDKEGEYKDKTSPWGKHKPENLVRLFARLYKRRSVLLEDKYLKELTVDKLIVLMNQSKAWEDNENQGPIREEEIYMDKLNRSEEEKRMKKKDKKRLPDKAAESKYEELNGILNLEDNIENLMKESDGALKIDNILKVINKVDTSVSAKIGRLKGVDKVTEKLGITMSEAVKKLKNVVNISGGMLRTVRAAAMRHKKAFQKIVNMKDNTKRQKALESLPAEVQRVYNRLMTTNEYIMEINKESPDYSEYKIKTGGSFDIREDHIDDMLYYEKYDYLIKIERAFEKVLQELKKSEETVITKASKAFSIIKVKLPNKHKQADNIPADTNATKNEAANKYFNKFLLKVNQGIQKYGAIRNRAADVEEKRQVDIQNKYKLDGHDRYDYSYSSYGKDKSKDALLGGSAWENLRFRGRKYLYAIAMYHNEIQDENKKAGYAKHYNQIEGMLNEIEHMGLDEKGAQMTQDSKSKLKNLEVSFDKKCWEVAKIAGMANADDFENKIDREMDKHVDDNKMTLLRIAQKTDHCDIPKLK